MFEIVMREGCEGFKIDPPHFKIPPWLKSRRLKSGPGATANGLEELVCHLATAFRKRKTYDLTFAVADRCKRAADLPHTTEVNEALGGSGRVFKCI